jgi:hypothetical protein
LENLKNMSQIGHQIRRFLKYTKINLGILDLGCGGGPDNIFKEMHCPEIVITYYGYDFNDDEIERLRDKYTSNFEFFSKKIITSQIVEIEDKWWNEFSAGQASKGADVKEYSKSQIVDNNFWSSELVNKSQDEITVEEILQSSKTNFNLLKIDLDGPDFGYLQDFFQNSTYMPQFVCLEINYQGSGSGKANTFHNTDRFMKEKGYDLMALTSRTYSCHSLPSRFEYNIFAQTLKGIPYQGDALYFKKENYTRIEEILRDVVLLDAFNLEDQAAKIILDNYSLFKKEDATLILDALTREVWGETFEKYCDLLEKWENDKTFFFPVTNKSHPDTSSNIEETRIKVMLRIILKKLVKKIFG